METQMKTRIYEHRSGLRVIPKEILNDVICVVESMNPVLSKNTVIIWQILNG